MKLSHFKPFTLSVLNRLANQFNSEKELVPLMEINDFFFESESAILYEIGFLEALGFVEIDRDEEPLIEVTPIGFRLLEMNQWYDKDNVIPFFDAIELNHKDGINVCFDWIHVQTAFEFARM